MNNLVIITGPTAVGKTEISIELAKAINGEIISADSIQVYKYMDTNQSLEYMNPYLATVGLSDWNQISGFDASAFNKNDF